MPAILQKMVHMTDAARHFTYFLQMAQWDTDLPRASSAFAAESADDSPSGNDLHAVR